jgi:long-subunit fatty acid transport protein
MNTRQRTRLSTWVIVVLLGSVSSAGAQQADERFVFDVGFGIDFSINGNVNSGAIGTLEGQTVAILPNSYGDVYGAGPHFRFGGGYMLNPDTELRGAFAYQSADADLVRMGDIGASTLYGQYSDYKTLAFDFGYRRYVPVENSRIRAYGEVTVGLAYIETINVQLAAPQSNVIFNDTDFYDQAAAFAWGFNIGALFPVAERIDVTAQFGLRSTSGLSDVDQFEGTGLDDINSDSARLTFPVVVGLRFRF